MGGRRTYTRVKSRRDWAPPFGVIKTSCFSTHVQSLRLGLTSHASKSLTFRAPAAAILEATEARRLPLLTKQSFGFLSIGTGLSLKAVYMNLKHAPVRSSWIFACLDVKLGLASSTIDSG